MLPGIRGARFQVKAPARPMQARIAISAKHEPRRLNHSSLAAMLDMLDGRLRHRSPARASVFIRLKKQCVSITARREVSWPKM